MRDVSHFIAETKEEQRVIGKGGMSNWKDIHEEKKRMREMRKNERRRQRNEIGQHREKRLTMSVVMQSRASFSDGEAVGVDGISAEVLKTLPWRALQKIKNACEMAHCSFSQEESD